MPLKVPVMHHFALSVLLAVSCHYHFRTHTQERVRPSHMGTKKVAFRIRKEFRFSEGRIQGPGHFLNFFLLRDP